jgi:hypothetical protein
MDVLTALRQLTQFSLPRRSAQGARAPAAAYPWGELADLAVINGVAPLVAYNMEYRLGGGGAPTEVHDLLLGFYQGTLNDNVFKLINLKQMLTGFEAPVLLLEAAAYADAIYPHVAFRPLPELKLLVRRADFF